MNPQSFIKSPGHFFANQSTRILCWCASLGFLLAYHAVQAGTTWDGGGGATTNIDTAANWDSDTLPTSLTDGTQTLTFGTNGSTATINTNVNALGLVINRDAAFTIANGAGNLTIGNGTVGTITVTAGGNTARTHTISESNLILAGNQTWSVSNTGVGSSNMQLTVSGNISGNFGIIKTGNAGVLKLTGNNSFTGGVIHREGFLNLGNANALGSGTLTIGDNTSSNSTASVTVNFDDASLTYNNDITLVHNGQAQPRTIQSRQTNTSLNGTITLSGLGNIVFSAGANQQLTINGKITGSTPGLAISLMNNGVGTVLLTNSANDFNSGVTNSLIVARGTLLLQGSDNANGTAGILGRGTGNLTVNGGSNANENAQVLITNGDFTIARVVNMNQASTASTFNTLGGNTANNTTFSGAITIAAGSNTTNQLTAATGGTVNFTGVISGTATNGLSKIGNGRAVLTGSNTYAGATAINAGALNVQNANALGGTANGTTVATGAALQLQGGITVGAEALSLSGTGVTSDGSLRNISGNNTYGGAITLATAARINSDAGLLTLTGGISGTQDLTIGGAGNTTISSVIGTSSGTLTKDGSGTLTLSGNNTYTGATTISAGTLQFAKAASLYNGTAASWTTSNITVNSGATLALNVGGTGEFTTGNVTTILGLATSINNNGLRGGSQIAFDTTNASGGTFIINDNIVNSSGTGNGTLGLVKLGANTLTLNGTNTYTGATTISAGTLQFARAASLYNGTAASWTTSNITVNSGATLALNVGGTGEFTTGNVTTILGLATSINNNGLLGGSQIAFDTTNASGGTFTINDNIVNSSGTGNGTLGLVKLGSNTLILTANNTYTGNTTISGGTLQVGAGSTAGALGSGAVVNNGALVFNRSDNITVANNISGTGSLTQNASSILTLNGTNTYSGLTNISGNGVIDVGTISSNAIPSGSGILIGSSNATSGIYGILQGNGNLTRSLSGLATPSSGQISGAAGGFAARGGQLTITFGNNASTELGLTQAGYAFGNNFVFGSSTADSKVLLQNNINLGSSSPRNITVNAGVGGDAATSVEFSGVIRNSASTGAAQINKNGNGMLILSNASNSFNGSVSINNGTVSVNRINSVGGGNSVLGAAATATEGTIALGSTTSTGRLLYTGSGDTTDRVINLLGTTGGGIIDQSGLGTLKFTSNFTATGSGSKTLTLQGSTAGIGEISGAVVNNSAANTTSLTKNGTGTWVLSGVNTYTGATTINAGTLSIAAITNGTVAGALGNSTNAVGNLVLGGGTLEYTGSANGATDRNFTLTAGTTSGISVTNSSAALTISGTSATTSGALTKAGSGTLILSGNNTYSGGTTINAGTLEIASTGRLGGGNYSASVT
ncbi:MAG: autotransporter-associated beta strand repeat-containing protein, partial [Verrucomicrobia bacterium]|nr:autotransporter-associated beta strand repeat-containing protein [Verrucomicrobiota bacterium]